MKHTPVLYSDDYGYHPDTDLKINTLILRGLVRGVSIIASMLRGKSLPFLPKLSQYWSNLHIGLHVNLVEGKSISARSEIPSLVDKKRRFYPLWLFTLRLLLKLINPKHIEAEIRNQLLYLKEMKLPVNIVDSHQHIHALSPVAEITIRVAKEYNIPIIRSYRHVETSTLRAKLHYILLKMAAFVSYVVYYRTFGLPATWHTNNKFQWSFLSWEGKRLNVKSQSKPNIFYVIHPYLGFDSNTSYLKILE